MSPSALRSLVGSLLASDLTEAARARGRAGDEAEAEAAALLRHRGRISALVVGLATVVMFPAWSLFDLYLEPALASDFIRLRLAALVPRLAILYVL